MNYLQCLYRRNNYGEPCVWGIRIDYVSNVFIVEHGIVGKKITTERIVPVQQRIEREMQSKIDAKRKTGYKYLNELKDDNVIPQQSELITFLRSYLPVERTNADGKVLAMLAKSYENDNNKLYSKNQTYYGQWKINGLRCFISASSQNDMFNPIKLAFQSREGEYWEMTYLEEYLLSVLPKNLLDKMIDEHYILDGEVYIPGFSINQINHAVKDKKCPEHKLVQYWCYDIAIEESSAYVRSNIRKDYLKNYIKEFKSCKEHLNNKEKLICLPDVVIDNDDNAVAYRDKFIDCGFEGLIMRNTNSEYQFGSRSIKAMLKYKKATDGKFVIVDIKPEGAKRPDIPIIVCKNDINDELFECHISDTLDNQKKILLYKNKYIGKSVFMEFGERSGVNQVPFHIKKVTIVK